MPIGMSIGKVDDMEFYQPPLFNTIRNYFTKLDTKDKVIHIFVPYIKTQILEKLIDGLKSRIVVITSWDTRDILSGSSELGLYPFCKEKRITLYINNKIHLKVFSVGMQSAFVSTGNISQRGLMPDGNYECGVLVEKLSNEERLFFEKIKKEARLVNDVLYQHILNWYQKQTKQSQGKNEFDNIVSPPENDDFLISALPMTKDVFLLVEGYEKLNSGLEPSDDEEITACIYHDLANYEIELGLTKQKFLSKLKIQFFSHPFTKKIDSFIEPEAYFGEIKEWIQKNCTDVPIPSRRELTENVQVLYEWFEKLGDGKYSIDVPGEHSQRIRKVKS